MLLYLFKDSYFAFYVLIVVLFVCLFSSALNWTIQRYSNNIEISLFLEFLQTRKLLSLCQFLPCLLQYIAPNDRVIKTKSGLQQVDKRWMVMNLYSTSSYKASKKISMLKVIYDQYGVPCITFLLITYEKVVKCLDSNLLKSTDGHGGRIKNVNITCEPCRHRTQIERT